MLSLYNYDLKRKEGKRVIWVTEVHTKKGLRQSGDLDQMEFNKNLGKQDMNSDGQYHTILSGTQGEENVKSISEEMR